MSWVPSRKDKRYLTKALIQRLRRYAHSFEYNPNSNLVFIEDMFGIADVLEDVMKEEKS